MKKCTRCKRNLSKSKFNKLTKAKDGLQFKCKECQSEAAKERRKNFTQVDRDRQAKAASKWRSKNKDHIRQYNFKDKLKRNYGITLEEYNKMWKTQRESCKLCLSKTSTGKGFCVDHCHESGKVRGILCHFCNVGLGHFRDNPELLRKAIRYIEEIDSI